MQIQFQRWLGFYVAFCFCFFFLLSDYQKISLRFLSVNYLEIGQGDATLFITPENQKILIDTGPPGSLMPKIPKFLAFFDKKIDLLILTHTDLDHLGSAFDLLNKYSVRQVLLPQDLKDKKEFENLLLLLEKQNIPFYFAHQKQDWKIGQSVYLDFLYPLDNLSLQTQTKLENNSLIFKIIYGKTAFLFSGDAGIKEEKSLVLSRQNLKSEIYQVGHHGSKNASSIEFLSAIKPQISIISAAKENAFGHPHPEALKRLNNVKSTIYQTAQTGDLIFYSDGQKAWLQNTLP